MRKNPIEFKHIRMARKGACFGCNHNAIWVQIGYGKLLLLMSCRQCSCVYDQLKNAEGDRF